MKNAKDVICADLGLPKGDSYTQDWAYEIPEEFRTCEWLCQYIQYYANPSRLESEKKLIMELILDVANDLTVKHCAAKEIDQVFDLLYTDHSIHEELIQYWSLDDEPLDDSFALTPKMRVLRDSLTNP